MARVVVTAPSKLEAGQRWAKKTDGHDARKVSILLSKEILSKAGQKIEVRIRIFSLTVARRELLEHLVLLLDGFMSCLCATGVEFRKGAHRQSGC